MKKEMLLIFILMFMLVTAIAQEPQNQTLETQEPEQLYTENAYGIFYIILTSILLAIAILAVIIALPRIKTYT